MSFGIPVRNGLSVSLVSSTFLSSGRRLNPALNLDFLTGGPLDPRITFSRTSQATLVDSTGKLTYAPNNLLLNSQDFESANWSKAALGLGVAPVVTANAAVAPDGTTTADRVQFSVPGNTTNPSDYSQLVQIPAGSGTAVVGSVWMRSNTGTNQTVMLRAGDTFTSVTVTPTWQRFTASQTTAASSNAFNIGIRGSVTPNVVSADVLLWGAQLEQVTYQTTPGTYNSTSPKNLLGYTQEFDNAAWVKVSLSATANSSSAPDGSVTADTIAAAAATSGHSIRQLVTVSASTPYVFSVYARAGTNNFIQLANTGDAQAFANFDLANGAVGTAGTKTTASIVPVGNGWYRCSAAFNSTAALSNDHRFYITSSASAVYGESWTTAGTETVYIWGAQLSNSASLDPYVYNPVAAPTSAAYYGPRFDYDPVTLANKGLLIEEQRTNLLVRSQEFDNAAWSKLNATVTANATTSPDGTVDADFVVADTTNAQHGVYQAATAVSGTTYTHSVYAKAGGYNWLYMTEGNNVTAQASFNLATGALGTVTGTGSPSATITPVGNGWYRCTLTLTPISTVQNFQCRAANANGGGSFTGDGTSGIFVYGAQLEAGSFATSYIPTVASQVTRTADVATMLGSNFSNWYNQNEGTFVADSTSLAANARTLTASAGAVTDQLFLQSAVATSIAFNVYTAGAFVAQLGSLPASATKKVAGAYKTNDFAASVDGSAVATDTSGGLAVYSQMNLGANALGTGAFLNGYIRRIGYYNTRLANTALVSLTAQSTIPSLSLDFTTQVFNVG